MADRLNKSSFVLKLYITGQTPRSQRVIARVHQLTQERLNGLCEPIVIDVLEQPQLAEQDRVLATPTLIRQFPLPVRRIVGDLSDMNQVIEALGLDLYPAI